MIKIVLVSWRYGLDKVSLSKLQVDLLGKSLIESKFNVDSLLDDKKVVLEIDNMELAKEFLKYAGEIGVNCEFLVD